jgi:uncharacterized membrane protein YobD (UPF0266 family)
MTDILPDNNSLPAETIIRFSRGKAAMSFIFAVLLSAFAIINYSQKIYFFALLLIAATAYLIYTGIKIIWDRSPQLILNDKGIETKKNGFISWKDLSNEQVVIHQSQYSRRGPTTVLEYDDSFGTIEFNIDKLDITAERLGEMLYAYRKRYEEIYPNIHASNH